MNKLLNLLHNGWVRLLLYIIILPVIFCVLFYDTMNAFVAWLLMSFIHDILIHAYKNNSLTSLFISFISGLGTVIGAIIALKNTLFKKKDD